MAKRFTDTDIWKKGWFMKLPAKLKLFWKFLCDDCDAAGVWEPNFDTASLFVGETVTEGDLVAFGERVEKIENGKYWLTTFIEFQYSNNLSQKSPAHKKIFQSLIKNRLYDRVFGRVSDTLQEEDKEKDKEEEKEKEEEGGAPEKNHISSIPQPVKPPTNQVVGAGGEIYDAEQAILDRRLHFEAICMKTGKEEHTARDSLHKYHLYLEERERYPLTRKAVLAGFEKWLLNEKQFSANGTHKPASSAQRNSERFASFIEKGKRRFNEFTAASRKENDGA
ncbi:MAG TPA: hypothetical protein VD996_02585 [Chitinophagaceae bacterium]|nr:hypothetical protein [Chitinophagaceae bacterium]